MTAPESPRIHPPRNPGRSPSYKNALCIYGRQSIIIPYLFIRQLVGAGSSALSQQFRRRTGRTREAPEIQIQPIIILFNVEAVHINITPKPKRGNKCQYFNRVMRTSYLGMWMRRPWSTASTAALHTPAVPSRVPPSSVDRHWPTSKGSPGLAVAVP